MRSVQMSPPRSLAPYFPKPPADGGSGDGGMGGASTRTAAGGGAPPPPAALPAAADADTSNDPSLLSATPLTHSAGCRCPHLDAVLPHTLRLDRFDPIASMHLEGHFGDMLPAASASSASSSSAGGGGPSSAASSSVHHQGGHGHQHHHQHHHGRSPGAPTSPSAVTSSAVAESGVGAVATAGNGGGNNKPSSSSSSSSKRPSSSSSSSSSSSGGGGGNPPTFGPEHARLVSASARGGAAEYWTPLLPPLYVPGGGSGGGGGGGAGGGSGRSGTNKRGRNGGGDRKRKLGGGDAVVVVVEGSGGGGVERGAAEAAAAPSGSSSDVKPVPSSTEAATVVAAASGAGGGGTASKEEGGGGDAAAAVAEAEEAAALAGSPSSRGDGGPDAVVSASSPPDPATSDAAAAAAAAIAATESKGDDKAEDERETGPQQQKEGEGSGGDVKAEKGGEGKDESKEGKEEGKDESKDGAGPPKQEEVEAGPSDGGKDEEGDGGKKGMAASTDESKGSSTDEKAELEAAEGDKDGEKAEQAEERPKGGGSEKEDAKGMSGGDDGDEATAAAADKKSADQPSPMDVDEDKGKSESGAGGSNSMEVDKVDGAEDEGKNKDEPDEANSTPGIKIEDDAKAKTEEAAEAAPKKAKAGQAKQGEAGTEVGEAAGRGDGTATSPPAAGGTVKADAETEQFPSDAGAVPPQISASSAQVTGGDKKEEGHDSGKKKEENGASEPSQGVPSHLSDSRYNHLRLRERKINRERDNVLLKPRVAVPASVVAAIGGDGGGGGGGAAEHQRAKRRKTGAGASGHGSEGQAAAVAPGSAGGTLSPGADKAVVGSAAPAVVSDDEPSERRRRLVRSRLRLDATVASARVEEWLEVLRVDRAAYWDGRSDRRNGSSPLGRQSRRPCCAWCPSHSYGPSGLSRPSGDELMRCLDCSVVGCGPCSTYPDSEMHMMRHFLASGHNFGVSCGPRSEIYCFRCGDFVYHEVFDQEKERIDIVQCLPCLGWQESLVQRSYEPMSFVTTSDHGVLWRGMMASYPSSVPLELVVAGRLSLRRFMMFRGELEGHYSLTWGPKALKLAIHQNQSRNNSSWKISKPVGLYNLGNTCFMSSVLQCLVNCVPLQRHFLRDVMHHHKSCEVLLRSSREVLPCSLDNPKGTKCGSWKYEAQTSGVCIACEMDLLFLEYFASTIGKDVLAALEEVPPPSAHFAKSPPRTGIALDQSKRGSSSLSADPNKCGHPLVPSSLLTAAWKIGGMKHLAGYEQRDAHEFLQAFLDIMGKHARKCSMTANEMSKEAKPINIKAGAKEGKVQDSKTDDIIKHLFEGTLRSVLICDKCGYKRSQPEPFLNVSLPLARDVEVSAATDTNSTAKPQRARTMRRSVKSCLQHFTHPEALADPVHCPSCESRTTTQKQHTFARLPRILCLHLKRFESATNKKITDPVSFPAHGLDMGPYIPHWCEVMQGTQTSEDKVNESVSSASSPQILYDLFATVNHTGTLHQGHYVSNVKVDGKWYHCNDAFVCEAGEGNGEKEVLQADGAYMLFYMRKDVSSKSGI